MEPEKSRGLNTNSFIAIGGFLLQAVIVIVTVTTSAADVKSEVAVIKRDIFYMQRDLDALKSDDKNTGAIR